MSLNIALFNAISGLSANTRSLDVTAQNVSNVNTEGYSRKLVSQESVVIAGQGAGVAIADVSRTVNEFMIQQLRDAITELGDIKVSDEFYGRMQDMFGTLASNSSIATGLGELGAKFQALSDTPENVSLRTDLVERARLLVEQMNDMATQIEELRIEVDTKIEDGVDIINTQTALVHDLNIQIAEGIALGQGVGELQDKRDIALDKIAEQMDIQQFTRSTGEIVVMTKLGRTLVDRGAVTLAHTPVSAVSPLTTHASGAIDGIDLGGADITTEIGGGKIDGLIEMRDVLLPNLHSQLRELVTMVHDEINAIHNQGTSFPGLSGVTSTRTVAAADPPQWTGNFRVAVTDTAGTVVEISTFDLSTMPTVGDLVTAINGMTNLSAAINGAGKIVITPTGTNSVVLDESTSAVTVANRTMGASDFLGLNDFFASANEYDDYSSSFQQNTNVPLGIAGTLTFDGIFGTTAVNYAAGDDLDAIAASINADATLTAAGITASIITDGTGYRLRINDSGNDNFFISDNSTLLSTVNVKVRDVSVVGSVNVRSDIIVDPSLISRGQLDQNPALAAGDVGVSIGDKTVVQAMANRFNAKLNYDATNLLAASSSTFAQYGTEILALNSAQANAVADNVTSREVLVENLKVRTASISGVNLDEELSLMIVLQNAYAASARVVTVTQNMFDMLTDMMR